MTARLSDIARCTVVKLFTFFLWHELSGHYGHHLNVWDWAQHKLVQRIDLGPNGMIPLEIRFLHDPSATEGYVGCALSTTVFRFFRKDVSLIICLWCELHNNGNLSLANETLSNMSIYFLFLPSQFKHYKKSYQMCS